MKNKYIFEFENEITEINELIPIYKKRIKKIINKYLEKENYIKDYIQQKNIMHEYRKEIVSTLKEIINSFTYFNNNAIIYLTGSYARNTVRIYSDLDLNIIYVKGTGTKYMKYEELFYYYICEIFDMKREGVHAIITAFNNEDNYEYVINNIDENPIDIELKDNNNLIKYSIPVVYKKRFYLQYMNNKNYKEIFDNLIVKNKRDGMQEWSNNFLFLNNNATVGKYYESYQAKIIENITKAYVENEYKSLIDKKEYIINYFDNVSIKKDLQMKELHFLYKTIFLVQILNLKKSKRIYTDFNELYLNGDDKIKVLIDEYYKYNYLLSRLHFAFNKYQIPYSIHLYQKINLDENELIKNVLNEIVSLKEEINYKYINILKGVLTNVIE